MRFSGVVACPGCLSRVAAGTTQCPGCDTTLAQAPDVAPKDLPCPRCGSALAVKPVGDVMVDECLQCAGVFVDLAAIKRVTEYRNSARVNAILDALPKDPPTVVEQPVAYLRCPACSNHMSRRLAVPKSGIIIDICPKHGTFFDGGELPRIVELVTQVKVEREDPDAWKQQFMPKADAKQWPGDSPQPKHPPEPEPEKPPTTGVDIALAIARAAFRGLF